MGYDAAGGWIPQDDGQGNEYYYNTLSGETTWDKPPELMTAEEKEAGPSESGGGGDEGAGYAK